MVGLALPIAVAGSALGLARWPRLGRADAILVLGGAISADGTLHASTRRRVEAGVGLWRAGAAAHIVVSGGPVLRGSPSAAEGMARSAVAAGLPLSAVLLERRAQSTLQNALFTAGLLGPGQRVIVVTDGYHLARSLLLCRWAGLRIAGWSAATVFGGGLGLRAVLREAGAWVLNPIRLVRFHVSPSGAARERRLARTPPGGR
ncbi:MAG: YdcF family protein [Pseudomonadota bacterium]